MLRLQKFTKPALQRRMLFPRCQAEWFDIFRCISYHFSIFFFLFCHCSCTVCLETLVLGRFCRQVANHCASVTATRFQGHEWHMQDFSKVRQTLRIKGVFLDSKGKPIIFLPFLPEFHRLKVWTGPAWSSQEIGSRHGESTQRRSHEVTKSTFKRQRKEIFGLFKIV